MTVIIPLLDDVAGIGECLASIRAQRGAQSRIVEILVADGGSSDGSRELVQEMRRDDDRIQLLENPDRFVPTGLNQAIRIARGEVIVRVDSHTTIERDYVDTAVAVLAASDADVVGGPMRPRGQTPFGEAVAWALCSRWGIGGSRFHDETAEGEADGVYLGVFPRATFERFGAYDVRFQRNQDDELTYRIREQGGRVWLSPTLRSRYTPRHDLRSLVRQFHGYGRFKPLVLRLHPSGLRLRHLAPPAATVGWLMLPVSPWLPPLAVPALVHAALLVAVSVRPGLRGAAHRSLALLGMHLGYGSGFLAGSPALLSGRRGRPRGASGRPGAAPARRPPAEP